MTMPRPRLRRWPILLALGLCATAQTQAQAGASSPGVWRCGNSYGSAPCASGKVVAVDDARSEAQRRQALEVKAQDARLARDLAAERHQRERENPPTRAARLGPSEAERAHAEALAGRKHTRDEPKAKKRRKVAHRPKAGPAA